MCHRICSSCKKYLGKNSYDCEQVTHGYCKECLKKAEKEVDEFVKELSNEQKFQP